jgi:hypothetical protein
LFSERPPPCEAGLHERKTGALGFSVKRGVESFDTHITPGVPEIVRDISRVEEPLLHANLLLTAKAARIRGSSQC